ncbi:MAG: hypothetical protein GJV46_05940 [Geobacter sp.]|nr:hypothetical protein [Geobacter sp.]
MEIKSQESVITDDAISSPGQSGVGGSHESKAEKLDGNGGSSSEAVQTSEDEARLERLNSIRKQLSEGTYNISGKDVADKILKVIKG